jgi:hypothetical protein
MPNGKHTPIVQHTKMVAAALSLRDQMAECTLSDAAIALVCARLNTGKSIAKLARGLGIPEHNAYLMLRTPQAQHLMSDLARTMLGEAAVAGVQTMTKIMQSKDHALAYRAAEHMMERAGLGLSQRATPDGSAKTVFSFAFGAPQAVEHTHNSVAHAGDHAQMGPASPDHHAEGPLKTRSLGSGEGEAPVILEPTPGEPLHNVRRRRSTRV